MRDLIASLRLVVFSILICCVVYPALLLAFAGVAAPRGAEGSLIVDSAGRIIGSESIAQGFTRPEYFWPRPSAVDYNATATGGSNLSPANPKITDRARGLIERYAPANGERVPADLVTASGSGMDPHISLAAARFQATRVAAARGRTVDEIEALLDQNTDVPSLEVFGGEPLVHVLRLNLALDRAAGN
jgi:K+-transporting ATPase ATPase C chain